jgi:type III restriction enzyme
MSVDLRCRLRIGICDRTQTERQFAQAMDSRADIRLYIKLPKWFRVDTPLGSYIPDWAIVKENDSKV